MAKKSKKSDEYQQLSLLEAETENDSTAELSDDDWMSGDDSDFQETSNLKVETQSAELLTLKILQDAIKSENDGDLIMQEFSDNVLPNLLRVAVGVTAKGGKFFDYFDEKREKEIENFHKNNLGKSHKIKEPKKLDRRNAGDQSLNTHLLNGLSCCAYNLHIIKMNITSGTGCYADYWLSKLRTKTTSTTVVKTERSL